MMTGELLRVRIKKGPKNYFVGAQNCLCVKNRLCLRVFKSKCI